MDSARFGQTQFQERLTVQRGLEGELTRSITAMAAVQNARVHLALPNQNGFFREQQKPSASVMLTLHAGRTLDRAQVAGIVHLVSSSVPELDPKAVSVLDQSGALLTSGGGRTPAAGLDAQQLQYVSQIETGYGKRIFELLEPIVGRDNLRASVTADVDFSQTEATSEEFKPNQGADATVAIRSQQTTEQTGSSGGAPSGVPGAASNQPPVPATAPVTGAAAAAAGRPRRWRQQQRPPRRHHQLRGRQDGARDAQRQRQHQAPERRRGREPPQRDRRQGQDHAGAADERRTREADRAGAREHRLQAGPRRFGQGDQHTVPRRDRDAGRRAAVETTRTDRHAARRRGADRAGENPVLSRLAEAARYPFDHRTRRRDDPGRHRGQVHRPARLVRLLGVLHLVGGAAGNTGIVMPALLVGGLRRLHHGDGRLVQPNAPDHQFVYR